GEVRAGPEFLPPVLMAVPGRSIQQDVLASGTRVPNWVRHAPLAVRDPVLCAAVLWTVVIAAGFVLMSGRTDWQVRAYWIGQLPLDLLLAWSSWRVSRIATGAGKRFWTILTAVGTLFLFGDTYQTVLTVLSSGK